MNVLILNAGSSSLKYQLMNMQTEEILAKGLCERVGTRESFRKYDTAAGELVNDVYLPDHRHAVKEVLDTLTSDEHGVLTSLSEIKAVGHRVVHGGDYFSESVVIDEEVVARIEECVSLAPLHNPAGLAGIRACRELMPDICQVAVFDTAFHQTMPPKAFMYALPYEYYEKHKIRRYGFHGTSHRYVTERAIDLLGKAPEELKFITCHIGNGASLAAIDGGKSVDTSMGFTPLEGLMMGTRSGSIDPAIVTYLIHNLGLSTEDANAVLNRQSGLLGVTEFSHDLRDVSTAADEGNERAQLACEMYAHSIKKYIGQYTFTLGSLDALIFTAGVGENSAVMRQMVLEGMENLGIVLDKELNAQRGGERFISAEDSRVKILVIPTNEELMIAKDVVSLCS